MVEIQKTIYSVKFVNLDVQEEKSVTLAHFDGLQKAMNFSENQVNLVKGERLQLDNTGNLEIAHGKELKYSLAHKKPAIYYLSQYGSYPCALYITKILVY